MVRARASDPIGLTLEPAKLPEIRGTSVAPVVVDKPSIKAQPPPSAQASERSNPKRQVPTDQDIRLGAATSGVRGQLAAVGRWVKLLVVLWTAIAPSVWIPEPIEVVPTSDVVRAYATVDRLPLGSIALIAVDLTAERFSAVEPAVHTLVDHLRARNARLVTVWTGAGGQRLAKALATGSDVVELGQIAGDGDAIRRLGRSDSNDRSSAPSDAGLRKATGGRAVDLLVVVTAEPAGAARWLSEYRRTAWPPGIAIMAEGDPWSLEPLVRSGQNSGILSGIKDVQGYRALGGGGALPMRVGGGSMSFAVAVAMLALAARGHQYRAIWQQLRQE